MADGLVDIGGGVKIISPDALIPPVVDPIKKATETLGLVNLIGQVKNIPLERRKLEAQTLINENDVKQIDFQNHKLRVELQNSIDQNKRETIKFFGDTIDQGLKLFQSDPTLGMTMLQKVIPNVQFIQNKDGSFTGVTPTNDGKFKTFLVDPNKVTDPNTRNSSEDMARKDFESQPEFQQYAVVDQYYKLAKQALEKPTGAGDVSIGYGAIKALDPTSSVMQGELANTKNTSGISQIMLNKINALQSGKLLGPEASQTRAELVEIIQRRNDSLQKTVKEIGRNQYSFTQGRGLNPQAVVRPVGELKMNDFVPIADLDKVPLSQLTKEQKLELYNFKTGQGQ